MKLDLRELPRLFSVGHDGAITIRDMGDIHLAPDEQLTFVTEAGGRFDFARKEWGYYATPSVNGRLVAEGFKTALVKNHHDRIYVMVVEDAKLPEFEEYCRTEGQEVLHWLDEDML